MKGKSERQLVSTYAVAGAGIGSVCGSGVLSAPGAAVGGAIGALTGKVLSMCIKDKYHYKCPRCGSCWIEEE